MSTSDVEYYLLSINSNRRSHNLHISIKYSHKDIFIIGGAKILNQLFELVEEFYLTRIYGNFDCDKNIDLPKIQESMNMINKIENDKTCHFEIWKK